jgi:hypothetical protein
MAAIMRLPVRSEAVNGSDEVMDCNWLHKARDLYDNQRLYDKLYNAGAKVLKG